MELNAVCCGQQAAQDPFSHFATYIFFIVEFSVGPRFLFIATELRSAAFRRSLPPASLCLAQIPILQGFVPMMCVAGAAYGLLSLDVTSSSRNLRFFLGTCLRSSLSESSGILGLLSNFRGFEAAIWDKSLGWPRMVGSEEVVSFRAAGRECSLDEIALLD